MKNISSDKLRRIKQALPKGSMASIAKALAIDEQTVRKYFGAGNTSKQQSSIIYLEDDTILNSALQILGEKAVDYTLTVQTPSSEIAPESKNKEEIFKKMESLRKRLQTKVIPSEIDITALANEVNS